jgi:hypothetical protein
MDLLLKGLVKRETQLRREHKESVLQIHNLEHNENTMVRTRQTGEEKEYRRRGRKCLLAKKCLPLFLKSPIGRPSSRGEIEGGSIRPPKKKDKKK